jgi:hypothetical protein
MGNKPSKPARKPETKEQRQNRLDSTYTATCGARYATQFELAAHSASCWTCRQGES